MIKILNKLRSRTLFYTLFLFASFYFGFKTAISLRAWYDNKLIPNFVRHFCKYDKSEKHHVHLEGFMRNLVITDKEYKNMIMETYFEMETKPLLKWFVENCPTDAKILDLGGATGIQWKAFEDTVIDKNLEISVIDIDKHSLEWGKKNNLVPGVDFYHTDELDKIADRKYDIILVCEVYMQMKDGNKIVKDYLDRYPESEILMIHSSFPDTISTKIFSFIKRFFLGFTYLKVIQGRALTDNEMKREMNEVGLEIVEEIDLTHLSNSSRLGNKIKAYRIKNKKSEEIV